MVISEGVIYYTHESWDTNHRVVDQAAIITGIVDENTVDLAVFPVGGPVMFVRVSRFDDANEYQPGLSFWRGPEEDPPDFAGYFTPEPEPEPEPAPAEAEGGANDRRS